MTDLYIPTEKPWYRSLRCSLGIHRGQWDYVIEGDCTQTRTCGRCGVTHTRTKHQREWRYVSSGRCEQVQHCTRCESVSGDRIEHVEHVWSDSWEPKTRWWQGDKEAHRCLRCGVVEEWTVNDGD